MTQQPDRESDQTPEARDLARAQDTIAGMLATRGIEVEEGASSDDLARLLDTVELFEEAVARAGGDSMTNALDSADPDDPRFVLPERHEGEALRAYIARIRGATERLSRAD